MCIYTHKRNALRKRSALHMMWWISVVWLLSISKQSTFLQKFGLWAADLFQEEPDTTKEMQSNRPQGYWQARPWHSAQHKAAEKEDKFKAKSNSQLQKPRAGGQNKQTTLLAFFRPDVTGMMLAVVTSLMLAVLFRHGIVAVLGDSLPLEAIPVSECWPSVYLSVKLGIQYKHSLHVLGIQFSGTEKEGASFKTSC